jgi:hypothetical protein
MATASDANIYINKTKCPTPFCTWFHYHLLKPSAKGGSALTCFYQDNELAADCCESILGCRKTVEKKRFEETVEKALTDRGKTFVGLSITEKLTRLDDIMKTNEESTNGEFNVDFGKFFKKQARNLDVTIFEET